VGGFQNVNVRGTHLVIGLAFSFAVVLVLSVDEVQSRLPRWFDPGLIGNAGEWFAGLAGVAVLIWTVGEPVRTRIELDELRISTEAKERLSEVRSVVLFATELDEIDPPTGTYLGTYDLNSAIANHGSRPIRRVRLFVEWTEGAYQTLKCSAPAYPELNEFSVADALAPGKEITRNAMPRVMQGPGRGHANQDVALLRLRFTDVHGDVWTSWFGPNDGHDLLELTESRSDFWTTDRARRFLPTVPAEAQAYADAAVARRRKA
jgi:hypothetical protein